MKLVRTNRERTQEEVLSEDLENMYRRATDLEKGDGARQADALDEHYRTLKLDPSASEEEVRQAHIYLAGAWDPNRFTGNPEWKQRAEAKRAEINRAYETIMSSQEKDFKGGPGEPLGDSFEHPVPKSENRRQDIFRRSKIAILAAGAMILFGIFIWPTPYHHDTMTAGDKTYPVRMNRITGQMAYLEDGRWNPMPILRVEMFSVTPSVTPPATMPKTVAPTPETQGVQKAEGPVAPVKTEAPRAVTVAQGESAKKEASVPGKDKPFAIQIRAIRDGERARTIVNELKQGGMDGHLEAVPIKDQGTWYRIFVGHFATKEEALKHLNEGLLSSQYPGSFVQKVNR